MYTYSGCDVLCLCVYPNTKRKNVNSTSAVSCVEKVGISELLVGDADALKKSGSRINSSFVWRYFGASAATDAKL